MSFKIHEEKANGNEDEEVQKKRTSTKRENRIVIIAPKIRIIK